MMAAHIMVGKNPGSHYFKMKMLAMSKRRVQRNYASYPDLMTNMYTVKKAIYFQYFLESTKNVHVSLSVIVYYNTWEMSNSCWRKSF